MQVLMKSSTPQHFGTYSTCILILRGLVLPLDSLRRQFCDKMKSVMRIYFLVNEPPRGKTDNVVS